MTEILAVEHKGKRLNIEIQRHCFGRPENPVLVFLHEGLGAVSSWKDIPKKLSMSTACNAFVYSRLGYGGSDPVALPRKINYLHVEALALLPVILKAAQVHRYIIIGHSDGGSIGIIHAGSGKAKGLEALVTLAAHLFCEPVTLAGLRVARERYTTQDLKQKLMRIHGKNTETAFWGWNDTWLSPGFAHWDIQRYLAPIRVPVMALQGAQDPYGTEAQIDVMETGIPDCTSQLIDNCGHIPHLEQEQEVLQSITGFLRGILTGQ